MLTEIAIWAEAVEDIAVVNKAMANTAIANRTVARRSRFETVVSVEILEDRNRRTLELGIDFVTS